jgi:hypothetical protein
VSIIPAFAGKAQHESRTGRRMVACPIAGYPPQQPYPTPGQPPYPPGQTYPERRRQYPPHHGQTVYPSPPPTLMVDPGTLDRSIQEAILRADIPALVRVEVSKLIGDLKDEFENQVQQQTASPAPVEKIGKIRSRKRSGSV